MARKVKCRSCLEFDEVDKMIRDEKKRYFHIGECYENHLKHEKFLRQEKIEWDELYQYIKELHGIPEGINLPSHPITRLQALRNGEDIAEGKKVKKYKTGATYSLILAAYKLQEDKIRWFIENVLHGKSEAKDINAVITMAVKSLAEAWRQEQLRKKREIDELKLLGEKKEDQSHYTTVSDSNRTRKSHDDLDISALL